MKSQKYGLARYKPIIRVQNLQIHLLIDHVSVFSAPLLSKVTLYSTYIISFKKLDLPCVLLRI